MAASSKAVVSSAYPRIAGEAIHRATTTIDLAMYFIILDPRRPDDPVAPLVDALVDAQRRGVRVTIVVEDGKHAENAAALTRLRQGGVIVRADPPGSLLHAKALVVDERWALVGSANWSRAALTDNAEAAILVDDPMAARPLAEAIRRWADHGTLASGGAPGVADAEAVAIPTAWVRAGGVLSQCVERRADLAFRLALAVARDGVSPDSGDPAAWRPYWRELGVTQPRTQRKVRRQLTALSTAPDSASRAAGLDAPPWESTITVPRAWWTQGHVRRLSTRAQLLYLVSLAEAARSTRTPCWFRSQQDLARATGLSDVTVGLALLELERGHLLTVHRDPARPPVFSARQANQYCVIPLVEADDLSS